MTLPGELMRHEIAEQPVMLGRLPAIEPDPAIAEAVRRRRPAHLQIVTLRAAASSAPRRPHSHPSWRSSRTSCRSSRSL